jgi:hypothetical protein
MKLNSGTTQLEVEKGSDWNFTFLSQPIFFL